jgi:hypothetical protein
MALKVECTCGKTYQVPDDAAGKRLKCPACGQALLVPEAPTEESPAEAAGTCPNCGADLKPGAVFCGGCGTDLRTGSRRQPQAPAVAARGHTRRAIVLPWGRIIGAAALVGVVAAAWFGLLRPILVRSAIDDAMKPAEKARYETTLQMLREAQGKAYGAYAEEVEFRIAQIGLEKQFEGHRTSPEGRAIRMKAVPEVAESGELLLNVTFRNTADQPITLRRRAFYLVSASGMAPAVGRSGPTVEGVLVAPGQVQEGLVAFRRLPGSPFGLITADAAKQQMLVYNDGTRYRPTPFILLGKNGLSLEPEETAP